MSKHRAVLPSQTSSHLSIALPLMASAMWGNWGDYYAPVTPVNHVPTQKRPAVLRQLLQTVSDVSSEEFQKKFRGLIAGVATKEAEVGAMLAAIDHLKSNPDAYGLSEDQTRKIGEHFDQALGGLLSPQLKFEVSTTSQVLSPKRVPGRDQQTVNLITAAVNAAKGTSSPTSQDETALISTGETAFAEFPAPEVTPSLSTDRKAKKDPLSQTFLEKLRSRLRRMETQTAAKNRKRLQEAHDKLADWLKKREAQSKTAKLYGGILCGLERKLQTAISDMTRVLTRKPKSIKKKDDWEDVEIDEVEIPATLVRNTQLVLQQNIQDLKSKINSSSGKFAGTASLLPEEVPVMDPKLKAAITRAVKISNSEKPLPETSVDYWVHKNPLTDEDKRKMARMVKDEVFTGPAQLQIRGLLYHESREKTM